MREDFTLTVKETLAKRVAFRCSNPACRKSTSGPQGDPAKAINVGVAAHITAASSDGPRYDAELTADERKSMRNAIWLCQTCAKLVDNDEQRYTVGTLRQWKATSETTALRALENGANNDDDEAMFSRLEDLMADLLGEMRRDLKTHPLSREFVVLEKAWVYNARGNYLAYYYEDHAELDSKLRILQNCKLIRDITYTNAKRYVITEALARYFGV